ncbi:TPA: restriction endonuclease subunit S [Streptococcus pyogenes]|uniref:restriction endonuclease subunit S n=1 Tax=Streptococcus pyogenes TaxID=1314 RepID=UPI00109D2576|nr:restriction endonuclease subunit S [Streptococcus pyogenes]VGR31936.1 Type I restriction-modification system specificity subunit [Streptococcus pyogenes]VGR88192.1 Type I restriction-modification system specificity subunit [Streptococcus pyogenes]VGR89932.1 Type I restriction-modification system specificity subunit [Streptococcus pyogenes]VGU41988.1 Type I restriction-modification system specificity subunit [Streptococcus pyogenes]VGV02119.1 Type I restriction-modification system specificit
MTKSKQPQYRFDGFEGEWEEKILGDVVSINSGKDYKHLNSGNIPVYGTGGYMLSVDKSLAEQNGIGIGRKGTIDKPYILEAPFWTVDTLFYCLPEKSQNLQFIFSIFQRINWKKLDESTGVPSLSKQAIKKVNISTSSLPEQEAIGELFQTVDQLLQLQDQKLTTLKEQKQTFLRKMFPAQGQKVPEIRLQGFDGEWEEKKLGEISRMFSGGTPSVGISEYYNGNIPFIRSSEINSDQTELFITNKGLSNSSAKIVEKNTLLYALYGATSGEVGLSRISGAINQAILAIIPEKKYSSLFIKNWLYKQKSSIIEKYLQGGQGNLSGSIVKGLELYLPSLPEQEAIGDFFQTLDQQMSQTEDKLIELKALKQTLLNRLFV